MSFFGRFAMTLLKQDTARYYEAEYEAEAKEGGLEHRIPRMAPYSATLFDAIVVGATTKRCPSKLLISDKNEVSS